jgi:hypothetical protein
MTVAQLLVHLVTANPDAEVTIGPLVELVDTIHVVNEPYMGTPYVVLLPAMVDA